jgi:hypothetical protein
MTGSTGERRIGGTQVREGSTESSPTMEEQCTGIRALSLQADVDGSVLAALTSHHRTRMEVLSQLRFSYLSRFVTDGRFSRTFSESTAGQLVFVLGMSFFVVFAVVIRSAWTASTWSLVGSSLVCASNILYLVGHMDAVLLRALLRQWDWCYLVFVSLNFFVWAAISDLQVPSTVVALTDLSDSQLDEKETRHLIQYILTCSPLVVSLLTSDTAPMLSNVCRMITAVCGCVLVLRVMAIEWYSQLFSAPPVGWRSSLPDEAHRFTLCFSTNWMCTDTRQIACTAAGQVVLYFLRQLYTSLRCLWKPQWRTLTSLRLPVRVSMDIPCQVGQVQQHFVECPNASTPVAVLPKEKSGSSWSSSHLSSMTSIARLTEVQPAFVPSPHLSRPTGLSDQYPPPPQVIDVSALPTVPRSHQPLTRRRSKSVITAHTTPSSQPMLCTETKHPSSLTVMVEPTSPPPQPSELTDASPGPESPGSDGLLLNVASEEEARDVLIPDDGPQPPLFCVTIDANCLCVPQDQTRISAGEEVLASARRGITAARDSLRLHSEHMAPGAALGTQAGLVMPCEFLSVLSCLSCLPRAERSSHNPSSRNIYGYTCCIVCALIYVVVAMAIRLSGHDMPAALMVSGLCLVLCCWTGVVICLLGLIDIRMLKFISLKFTFWVVLVQTGTACVAYVAMNRTQPVALLYSVVLVWVLLMLMTVCLDAAVMTTYYVKLVVLALCPAWTMWMVVYNIVEASRVDAVAQLSRSCWLTCNRLHVTFLFSVLQLLVFQTRSLVLFLRTPGRCTLLTVPLMILQRPIGTVVPQTSNGAG